MKVIDLLNKIANGEEVPKKIQVYSDIFVFDYSNCVYEHEETRTNLLSIYNGNILNYEVRIKEDKPFNKRVEEIYNRHIDYIYDKEDKKIEKIKNINIDYCIDGKLYEHLTKEEIALDIQTIRHKLDEIIDYINKEK